jgi:folate-binding protein YgfZ
MPGTVIVREGVPSLVGIAAHTALGVVPTSAAPLSPAAAHAWELARIEAGRPRHGHEISDAFHPYEVGLWDDVHLSKGCYTGQEVLQRLMTYDSVRRRLVRVGGAGAVPSVPVPACVGEERVGTVTSAAATAAGWGGLAVLAKAAIEAGAAVRVQDGEPMSRIEPFEESPPRGLPEGLDRRR